LILSVDAQAVDMVFINDALTPQGTPTGSGQSAMGLLGIRERVTPIGGELQTLQEGKRWMTSVNVPLGTRPSGS
jgi:glucose-6-phosphate-specific signal transduction histidine kinase